MTTTVDEAIGQVKLAQEAVEAVRPDEAVAHFSAAIRGFTAAGDCRAAAMACVSLGDLFANYLGNLTAARAWFIRAERLIENEPPCLEQGWVALASMGCDVDDPAVLLGRAELALDRARQFGDVNLETKALADAGLAHVQVGRIKEGMAMLDEAMALACGPADDVDVAGRSVCSFFTACYVSADFERARSWAESLRRQGLIGDLPGAPVFVSSHCDSVQASALCELGRWSEAEALLTRAMAQVEQQMDMPSWHPAIALAELRIRQGRLAEAEMQLLGKDGHLQALLPAACLHLARGDHELARATATRGLRAVAGDRLRASELLAVLVDAELAAGSVDRARAACEELETRLGDLDVPVLQARAVLARARLLAAEGDPVTAIDALETGLDRMPPEGLPFQRALLLVQLVRLHDQAGNRAAARVEAKRAAAILSGLDVCLSAEDLALLERHGVTASATSAGTDTSPPARAVLRRDPSGWIASAGDSRIKLRDTKGLGYLAELLANPGAERHALDLVDRVEGVPSEAGLDRRHLGDAGELLDTQARTAYRRRIEELRSEIDDAICSGAETRAEILQAELDQLVEQLAQAFGLGDRSRRAASTAERARLNVTRALRAAVARLTEAFPAEGAALDRSLRTGLYCSYVPPDDGVSWIVQS